MEDFVTVTVSADEFDYLSAAARAAKQSLADYVRQAALQRAEADAQERAGATELGQRQKAIIAAYMRVMGLASADMLDHARVGKAAKAAAKAGRNPDELESVARWLRQTDNRWRTGRRIPLDEIVTQWAAWTQQATRPAAPTVAHAAGDATVAADQAAAVFGEIEW